MNYTGSFFMRKLFFILAIPLLFGTAQANTNDRVFECNGEAEGVSLKLYDSDDKTGKASFYYDHAVDPGSHFHHVPIYLPEMEGPPVDVAVSEDQDNIHYISKTLEFSLSRKYFDYDPIRGFAYKGSVIKGAPKEEIAKAPNFVCRLRRSYSVTPSVPCTHHCH